MHVGDLELLGSGREAEVFVWGEGRVLRLAREDAAPDMIEREATALAAAHAAGANVPGIYERVAVDERPGLVLDRVDGGDLLGRLERRPWSVLSVARVLGSEHAALHAIEAPAALPPLREDLRDRLGSPLVPARVRGRALERLAHLPDGDRLLHGDFHPGNLLYASHGCVVIEWTNGARGDPAADVARTVLLMIGGTLPDEASLRLRLLAPPARRALLAGYLRTYVRTSPLDRALVDPWLPVWAAARLSEGIEAERDRLVRRAS